MDRSFYATLYSKASMNTDVESSPSYFVNKLYKRFDLSGNWEVGLVDLILPHTICNVRHNDSCTWVYYHGKLRRRFFIGDMHVNNVELLLSYITKNLSNDYHLFLENGLVICKPNIDAADMGIRFSEKLAIQLGIKYNKEYTLGLVKGYKPPFFDVTLPKQLFLCTNIVKDQIFGCSTLNLLKTFTVNIESYTYGGKTSYKMSPPLYIPVSVTELESIIIYIKDETLTITPFASGATTVVLHFRERSQ